MITAQQASSISQAWSSLENLVGPQAFAFLHQNVAPSIEAAARIGQTHLTVQGVSPAFEVQLTKGLKHLGYQVVQMPSGAYTIQW